MVLQSRPQEEAKGLHEWMSAYPSRTDAELPREGTCSAPGSATFESRSGGIGKAMQRELVLARARIAELETALKHTRPGLEAQTVSSSRPHGSTSTAVEQQEATVVEGLLQQRGILRELLRAELRDIAKSRMRDSKVGGGGNGSHRL